jgi:hypothetical protein
MTKTQLLNLPNELLLLIFQCLSSIELVTTFLGLQSYRIQALIQPLTSLLDISIQDDQWIQTYLPDALVQRRIHGLRLKDRQIRFMSKYLSVGDIHSIEVINFVLNNELVEEDLAELRRYLKKLSITVSYSMREENLIRQLFPRNSNSEYFSSKGRFFCPINDKVYAYPHLTHLSIGLAAVHSLFILLHRLPNLEILKVSSFYFFLTSYFFCWK